MKIKITWNKLFTTNYSSNYKTIQRNDVITKSPHMVGNAFLMKAVVDSEVIADAGRMVQMRIMQGKREHYPLLRAKVWLKWMIRGGATARYIDGCWKC